MKRNFSRSTRTYKLSIIFTAEEIFPFRRVNETTENKLTRWTSQDPDQSASDRSHPWLSISIRVVSFFDKASPNHRV